MEPQLLPRESDQIALYEAHGLKAREAENPRLVERFSHLTIEVTDLDRSEAWYRDVIGMDVRGRNLTAEERPHAVLQMNTGQLFILVQSETVGHRPESRRFVHHAFLLTPSQYRRAYFRLKEYGYEIDDVRLHLRAVGEYSMDVADPDGHRYQIQTKGAEALEILLPKAGIVNCGPAQNYGIGDVRTAPDGSFFFVRLREGFLALSRWCTHMNGAVAYQKNHWRFYCPLHGATYDRRGVPTGRHARCPLRLHPVSFSADGHVLVNTDEVIERTGYEPQQAVGLSEEIQ